MMQVAKNFKKLGDGSLFYNLKKRTVPLILIVVFCLLSSAYAVSLPPAPKFASFKLNSPVRIKNSSTQVLAGRKLANTAIYVNNKLAVPANKYTSWYYEYPVTSKTSKVLVSSTPITSISQLNKATILNLDTITTLDVDPPRIFGYRFDPLTRDFIFNIQDPPGVLSYNIYYANSLSGSLTASPFILAQTNVSVSGTGTTTWRDNGTYTRSHPSQVAMRFYKLEVAHVASPPKITSISPGDGATFYEGDSSVIFPIVSNTNSLPLEYQFSIDDLVKQAWSTQTDYTWIAAGGIHAINVEVRNTVGNDSKQVEVCVFRTVIGSPVLPPG